MLKWGLLVLTSVCSMPGWDLNSILGYILAFLVIVATKYVFDGILSRKLESLDAQQPKDRPGKVLGGLYFPPRKGLRNDYTEPTEKEKPWALSPGEEKTMTPGSTAAEEKSAKKPISHDTTKDQEAKQSRKPQVADVAEIPTAKKAEISSAKKAEIPSAKKIEKAKSKTASIVPSPQEKAEPDSKVIESLKNVVGKEDNEETDEESDEESDEEESDEEESDEDEDTPLPQSRASKKRRAS
eukprot:g77081.t1